jgi:hypothetical protein
MFLSGLKKLERPGGLPSDESPLAHGDWGRLGKGVDAAMRAAAVLARSSVPISVGHLSHLRT